MRALFLGTSVALTLAACGARTVVLRAQPLESPDVRILPLEVYEDGEKLWVRVDVTNASQSTLTINRDYITAHLPSGQVVPRAQGTFAIHNVYVLPPGGMHAVYVEFQGEGFKWEDVASAQIDFSPGITRDGQPIQVPPFVVTR